MNVNRLSRQRVSQQYVALYLRISKDEGGRGRGVGNQEQWGRAYAAKTWPGIPVRVFVDNDISGASGAYRPAFEDLVAALERGEVAHLWTVEQSRLTRDEITWFQFARTMDAAGIAELHTKREGIVNVGDLVAGITALVSAKERRTMIQRVNDTLATNAGRGLAPGARRFGYLPGVNDRGDKTLLIVEVEAEVIRECAERILAGWSLSSIAADLRKRKCEVCPASVREHTMHGPHRMKLRDANHKVITEDGRSMKEGGKPVTRSSTITAMSVKRWMTNPSVAGKRVYRGEIIGEGNWAAILDESTWRAVCAKLAAPHIVQRSDGGEYPVTPTTRTTGRRYLLTGGTAVCGVCGAPLAAQMKQFRRKLKDGNYVVWKVAPYYGCHPKTGGKGCIGIVGDELEAYVVGRLLDKLDDPAFVAQFTADDYAARRDEIAAALLAIEEDRAELSRAYGLPRGDPNKLTMAEWQTARAGLSGEERRLQAELATVQPPMNGIDPRMVRADWDDRMSLDVQRDTVSQYINTVMVRRARPGTVGFDEGRVVIRWRDSR